MKHSPGDLFGVLKKSEISCIQRALIPNDYGQEVGLTHEIYVTIFISRSLNHQEPLCNDYNDQGMTHSHNVALSLTRLLFFGSSVSQVGSTPRITDFSVAYTILTGLILKYGRSV